MIQQDGGLDVWGTELTMHGTSFPHIFADSDAEERHTQRYFEITGYRAMYKDAWWLAQSIPLRRARPDVITGPSVLISDFRPLRLRDPRLHNLGRRDADFTLFVRCAAWPDGIR